VGKWEDLLAFDDQKLIALQFEEYGFNEEIIRSAHPALETFNKVLFSQIQQIHRQ
jgi:hypothetical protein